MEKFNVIKTGGVAIKAWTKGVQLDPSAEQQLRNVASLPFIHHHVAAMPDVHWGMGATVGSVIPCKQAIIPAAVGVDIGCGMMAVQTSLSAQHLPENLRGVRSAIEKAVPHGRTGRGDRRADRGAWGELPADVIQTWQGDYGRHSTLQMGYEQIVEKHTALAKANSVHHLGTLGTGNHFIEVCLDELDRVWVMLHSGSRGIGNRIGTYFIHLAKKEMERWFINLPDEDLAYLPEGSTLFNDYFQALTWAQAFAYANREVMMNRVLDAMASELTGFELGHLAVNCHHNYVSRENHFGDSVWLTRKGAVSAKKDELGIIPGSMGTRSYIVRGKGNKDSFCSCSHGAGRVMSRNAAKRQFTIKEHVKATQGVECRKDAGVIDETPMAYKDIDAVMAAQTDLVDVVHTLKQVVCVKG
ncbi:RtcB family protein [Magnetococcus sp. PR-3]|uniref:RtcB family protein n=1 Tax=Magnetococcus sp. PR-3 TaxID=3120355 RepID=UPI002FCE0986